MKNLKKVLLAVVTTSLLVACSGKNQKDNVSSKENDPSNNSNKSVASEIVKDGVIDLGTSADFPPYEFYDDNNKIVGIDAEIAQEIGKKLGVEVKIKDMDFSSIIASIESGKLDGGIAGITATEDRKKNVNFSKSYGKSVQKVIVKKDSAFKNPEDLKGKKIASQLGTTGEAAAKDTYGEENIQSFSKNMDAIVALNNGKVDGVVLDDQTAQKFAEANKDLTVLGKDLAKDEYAIALDKKNDKLLEAVNKAIDELEKDGTLDKIFKKYMDNQKNE